MTGSELLDFFGYFFFHTTSTCFSSTSSLPLGTLKHQQQRAADSLVKYETSSSLIICSRLLCFFDDVRTSESQCGHLVISQRFSAGAEDCSQTSRFFISHFLNIIAIIEFFPDRATSISFVHKLLLLDSPAAVCRSLHLSICCSPSSLTRHLLLCSGGGKSTCWIILHYILNPRN